MNAFGAAFGLGALVLVGGLSFAAGRWSADETEAGSGGPTLPQAVSVARTAGQGRSAGSQSAAGPDVAPGAVGAGTTQAQDADQDAGAEAAAGGQAGPGGRGGVPPGGVRAVVTGIAATGITVRDEAGQTYDYTVDPTTRIIAESSIDPAAVTPGDMVQVQLPVASSGDEGAEATSEAADVATTVTVLPPGGALPAAGVGGRRGPGDTEAAPGDGAAQRGEAGVRGAGGGRGGFGRAAVAGTVVDLAEVAITVELPSGEMWTVGTDAATSFLRQDEADLSEVSLDDAVLIQVARGGRGQTGDTDAANGSQAAGGSAAAAVITILADPAA